MHPRSVRLPKILDDAIPAAIGKAGVENFNALVVALVESFLLFPDKLHFSGRLAKMSPTDRDRVHNKLVKSLDCPTVASTDYLADRFTIAAKRARIGKETLDCLACKLIETLLEDDRTPRA